ncbi:MAG TPA: nickel-dependent hydrogenase large subunit [Methanoregulaceae archaeon]|nr:MAG: nickel-dependent hydrogenase large subunit [Methanolinea sp.]HON81115.1 nickel-dependent hydrogenase large subunit [Methanoregulaceae archaeon]HPD09941.1 nickel-dependent hydrogenase large subunit [Methanoregulaceae archaeon]HRT14868.1 nickel-dependent hydrogenase large subunit [Methanoregulaceae archaeon]HRU30517.1 nickel-dependent hydrogenase large subunit [Methanoregulaceae archaeon]
MSGEKKVPYIVPIGPTHPALKEPVMFTFEMEGERIREVDFAPGHVHRGIEWMGMRRNPVQIVHLTDRICGICGVSHTLAFSRAVEQVAGIEVPERADYIRTIIAEFERIQSHLLWAGVAAHELGFDSLLHLTWRVREQAMDVIENLTGNRVNYGLVQVGGVRRDIVPEQHKVIEDCLSAYEGVLTKLLDLFLHDKTIAMRCRDVGVLSKDDALKLCTVGPTARASGVNVDLRQDYPYCAYGDLEVRAILPDQYAGETRGDVYDRIVVRLLEVGQSCGIIRQCISEMPAGEITAEPKLAKLLAICKKARGEAIGRVEAPRGECFHYVLMEGKEAPHAWKVKASSYSNLMSWIPMLRGEQIADIPIIVASIDPCLSCTDRVAVVKMGSRSILSKEDLHRLSVEKTRRLQQ